MLSKISAEFENLESAEITARKIRENVDGIKKITLAGTYRKLEANSYGDKFEQLRYGKYTL